jgi:ribulose-phosphate 3-epimerase
MKVHIGVKSDPIESRYSFEWLFGLMREHGIHRLQYGSSTVTLLADDEYFRALRRSAESYDIRISSMFSSIREFGGFASGDPLLQAATRRMWERMIRVASLLGAESTGSNGSITFRDKTDLKEAGVRQFLANAKELMVVARKAGLSALTTEPMSCTWEFPSTPSEIHRLTGELGPAHAASPDTTVPFLLCSDISHGIADESRQVTHDNWNLFEMQVPWMWEFHFKNTDAIFNSTFGFSEEERARGIVDLDRLKAVLERNADRFPCKELVGYLEISGPKTGRDYTDGHLGEMLGASLDALRRTFG